MLCHTLLPFLRWMFDRCSEGVASICEIFTRKMDEREIRTGLYGNWFHSSEELRRKLFPMLAFTNQKSKTYTCIQNLFQNEINEEKKRKNWFKINENGESKNQSLTVDFFAFRYCHVFVRVFVVQHFWSLLIKQKKKESRTLNTEILEWKAFDISLKLFDYITITT